MEDGQLRDDELDGPARPAEVAGHPLRAADGRAVSAGDDETSSPRSRPWSVCPIVVVVPKPQWIGGYQEFTSFCYKLYFIYISAIDSEEFLLPRIRLRTVVLASARPRVFRDFPQAGGHGRIAGTLSDCGFADRSFELEVFLRTVIAGGLGIPRCGRKQGWQSTCGGRLRRPRFDQFFPTSSLIEGRLRPSRRPAVCDPVTA